MKTSRWMINRIGLIDFWYYDDEVFEFSQGRMLLRGANGSGKSVTMQSFIPLLLDGNKASERLDPFGTKARKLENYLLEENDDRDERTGYLYMEFKRENSDTFLTLGIGMRARKNKKLESWHFVITDGRRIGKDFFLYKNLDEKITLSRQELLLRLGDGGQLIDSAKDYMRIVNEKLFGYENVEEYKELVDLLIQLRTPKLSKDLKPTILNEILSESLPPLSDEDLRPMSEAIENMDNLKTQLESLQESKRASEKIMEVYKQYNQCVLYDKAKRFLECNEQLEQNVLEQKRLVKEKQQLKKNQEEEQVKYREYELEEENLNKQLESLNQHDIKRLVEKQNKCKEDLSNVEKQFSEKEKNVSVKEEKEVSCRRQVTGKEEACEIRKEEIQKKCEEMQEIFEQYSFEEHAFMADELMKNLGEPYSFTTLFKQIHGIQESMQHGVELLRQENEKKNQHEERMVEREKEQQQLDRLLKEKRESEESYEQLKNEWIEKFYQWAHTNLEYHLTTEQERQIVLFMQQYVYGQDFEEPHEILRETYERERAELKNAEWISCKQLDEKKQEHEKLLNEFIEWESKKDPEPEKAKEVQENRNWMSEEGISYEPLYKVLDFMEEVSEEQKDRLEEALLHMGLLDACVVPEHLRDRVMKKPSGMRDTYLFATNERVQNNLSKFLDISMEQTDIVFYQQLSNCLQAIGLAGSGNTWIQEDGAYKLGILEGTITGDYQAKYIGVKSREQYKQQKLEELKKKIQEKEQEVSELQEMTDALTARIECCEREYKAYPVEDTIKKNARLLQDKVEEIERKQNFIRELDEKIVELEKEIVVLRRNISEVCKTVYLKAELTTFQTALSEMNTYEREVYALQNMQQAYIHEIEMLHSYQEQLEQIMLDLDNLRYDLGQLRRSIDALQMEIAALEEQLAIAGNQEIIQKIQFCEERLMVIRDEKPKCYKKTIQIEDSLDNLYQRKEEFDARIKISQEKMLLFRKGFEDEWRLGLVEEYEESELLEKARTFKTTIWSENGKSFLDMSTALQESYHRYKGEMSEFGLLTKPVFDKEEYDEFRGETDPAFRRIIILARYKGKEVEFKTLVEGIRQDVEIQKNLVKESDRTLFEDILAHTISKKIRNKIYNSENWVSTMNGLMNQMNTSSGLKLSLVWKKKKAEEEGQLDTGRLVELLKKDAGVMTEEELEQLSKHFQSKVEDARRQQEDVGNTRSFHAIMKEILDYRKWFEFQLYFEKTGDRKRELTNNAFFTFSGGEKAMSMYVPLFSAVVAKYHGAREDAPRLVSLDEAFAGVDENNIKDMFRLMVDCEFEFIINSQILWGDVETLPSLAIYQLLRPENAKYVGVIPYHWDGKSKRLMVE